MIMYISLALRQFFDQSVNEEKQVSQKELFPDLNRLGQVLGWFEIYALEFANLDLVQELTISHFQEYFSFWYLRKVGEKTPSDALGHLSGIKQLLTWFADQNLLRPDAELEQLIQSLEQALPRLLQLAATIKISVEDERLRPDSFLSSLKPLVLSSLFQVRSKPSKSEANPIVKFTPEPGYIDLCNLCDLYNEKQAYLVKIPTPAWPLIQEGDILELTLSKHNHLWQIAGSGTAYPDLAARYLY